MGNSAISSWENQVANNVVINDNIINDFLFYGIRANGIRNMSFENNNIVGNGTSGSIGMSMFNVTGINITDTSVSGVTEELNVSDNSVVESTDDDINVGLISVDATSILNKYLTTGVETSQAVTGMTVAVTNSTTTHNVITNGMLSSTTLMLQYYNHGGTAANVSYNLSATRFGESYYNYNLIIDGDRIPDYLYLVIDIELEGCRTTQVLIYVGFGLMMLIVLVGSGFLITKMFDGGGLDASSIIFMITMFIGLAIVIMLGYSIIFNVVQAIC